MGIVNFKTYDLKDWIETIPESTQNLIERYEISPFSHFSKVNGYSPFLYRENPSTFKNITKVNIHEGVSKNIIHEALQNGCNGLILEISQPLSLDHWAKLYSGIQPEIIAHYLNGDDVSISSFLNFIKKENLSINGSYPAEVPLNKDLLTAELHPLITSHGGFEFEIKELLISAYHLIQKNPSSTPIFGLHLTDEYLKNIAGLFALKIAWIHLCESLNHPISIPRILTYNKYNRDDDFEHYLIKATIHCVSSLAGGSDGIYLHSPEFEHKSPKITNRIINNIPFICLMEGKMNKAMNPLEGSYYIEELANHMAGKAWLHFQNFMDK